MKKFLKKVLPAVICLATLCVAIAMFAACGPKTEATFKGDMQIGNLPTEITITLTSDNKCEVSAFIDTENEQFKSFEERLKASGTWEKAGEEYKLTIGEGDAKQVITSTEGGTKMQYSVTTEFGPKSVTCTKK